MWAATVWAPQNKVIGDHCTHGYISTGDKGQMNMIRTMGDGEAERVGSTERLRCSSLMRASSWLFSRATWP